jgi:putative SOS response-associated peptidase YedK
LDNFNGENNMCGRFSNAAKKAEIEKEFKISLYNSNTEKPRYNVAPGHEIDTVLDQEGERVLTQLKWGLVPSWAKDTKVGDGMINARAETVSIKPSF